MHKQNSSSLSVILSTVMTVLLFLGILVGAIIMPVYVRKICAGIYSDTTAVILTYLAYLILLIAAFADIHLYLLLSAIRKNNVFSMSVVRNIRAISYSCIAVGVIFLFLIPLFLISAPIAFIALLAGACLRVMKNAFEGAVHIKEENDLTI